MEYASISRRLVAALVDALILGFVCFLAGYLIPVIGPLVVMILYAPVFESSEMQATLGKYWMGIQVADLGSRRISLRAALIRYVVKFVSSVLLFIGHFAALFTSRRQALHDLVAETVVVYGRTERDPLDTWIGEVKRLFRSISPSSLTDLERLQALREKGALTEEEFQREKEKLMMHGKV